MYLGCEWSGMGCILYPVVYLCLSEASRPKPLPLGFIIYN